MASHWKIDVDGVLKDFNDNLDFAVTTSFGTGIPQFNNLVDELPLQDGSIFQKQKVKHRSFGLQGSIVAEGGETRSDVHAKRQAIIKAVMAYPELISDKTTPRTLRYTGGAVDKEIQAYYDGGLSDGLPQGWTEVDTTIRFIAPDPIFYATSETTTALDSNDSATFRLVAGRNNNQWSNLGGVSASGTYDNVRAIAEDDTYIYIGGDFENFNNIANADHIVRWNKSTETFSAMGTGMNQRVWSMVVSPDGTLYAGGSFTTAGGTSANRIASWNGSSWSALGSGLTNTPVAMAFGTDGRLYVGEGSYTSGLRTWNGSSWGTLSGLNNDVEAIAIDPNNGYIYVSGDATLLSADSGSTGAYYDGSAWNSMGEIDGASSANVMRVGIDGTVYAGGGSFVKSWNGTSWTDLGTVDDAIWGMDVDEFGDVWAGGTNNPFGSLGGEALGVWNGSKWTFPDISIPSSSSAIVYEIFASNNGVYIGFDTEGTGTYGGKTTISYGGTWPAYPYIEIDRSGGTSATIKSIRNETTGAIIYCSYDLADGEKLTFEFRAQEGIGVTSDYFGSVPNAILSNSDTGNFYLTPQNASGNNDNIITVFVDTAGSPTITSNIKYKVAYISLD
jgi:hypothetical protein